MSMRTLLSEVRSALTGYSDLTNLVPASKITFARRPQRDELPGMTFSIGTVDYDETVQSYAASTTYRVDVTVYAASADSATRIHDQVKLALLAASSTNFRIRISDERYFVDVDNNHMAFISCTWQHNAGSTDPTSATFLSPAFGGQDKMSINYLYQLRDGQETAVATDKQVYFMNLKATNGNANHNVRMPLAEDNLGKIYTFIFGENLHANRTISLVKAANSLEGINGSQSLVINRALSSCSLVAVRDELNPASYMWRVWAYYGLHD